ncbi:hypothetical protein LAUMK136_02079 [Mycobacterium attenuatum]|uniref:Uncharacterized protein n=1 Tax=Mycobacterium attenuatum TaxID=2341086 RepID=A0A498Q1J1_9MYCO|nr:hypothetical protein LAUMK136_02079 [Mycobacterium attenuatum]
MHGRGVIDYLFNSSVECVESRATPRICHIKIFCMIILAFDLAEIR